MPSFEELRDSYTQMWATAELRPERTAQAHKAAAKVMAGRAHYESVGGALGIPWYFIGLAHMRESYCNFGTHLHNGDSLAARTYHVPSGRPAKGSPPFAWDDSAIDALKIKGLQAVGEWPIEQVLYQLERFNGFGYRRPGCGPSPYLCADTDLYKAGKYVRDGVYSASFVDPQDGCIAVLKCLLELDPDILGVSPETETAIAAPKAIEPGSGGAEEHAEAHDILKEASTFYASNRYMIKGTGWSLMGVLAAIWHWLQDPLHAALALTGMALAVIVGIELLQLRARNKLMGA
jgi:lysozyme family protein